MRELASTGLDSFVSSPIAWLWPGRIPRGKLTMLCGDPGLGKSFLTMDLAARVSAAQGYPDAPSPLREPGEVLIMSAEDDPADTIRPRLEAAGADLTRIRFVEGVRVRDESSGEERTDGLELDRHADAMESALASMERPCLVIVDPVSAFLGQTDSHNNAQVRAVLARLASMARRFGPGIVCVSHLSKASQQVKAVYRQMGSLAFTAAARMVWQVTRLPGDADRRAMLLVKSNIESARTGLSFRITEGRVSWDAAPITLGIEEADDAESAAEAPAMNEATQFIKEALAGGPAEAGALLRTGVSLGMNERTLRRARAALGVRIRRAKGSDPERPWVWSLPVNETGGAGEGVGP